MATNTPPAGIKVTANDLGLINHIAFVLDMSGSMREREPQVIKMFDAQMKDLAKLTVENGQETRISVYLFDSIVECVCFDKDVLRIPDISKYYKARGSTSLIDATYRTIEDLSKTNALYGDHAFLLIAMTDGEENTSRTPASKLEKYINSLPENWTVACLVPDQHGVKEAVRFGFPKGNVSIWDMNKSVELSVGSQVSTMTTNFMTGRAKGVRGTKSVFVDLEVKNLTETTINNQLDELNPFNYRLFNVLPKEDGMQVRDFIVARGEPFTIGHAYYKLTKKETVQKNKQIAIRNKQTSQVFSGPKARTILGLPDQEVKVDAASTPEYEIFIQSNSVNRKLVQGTELIYIK